MDDPYYAWEAAEEKWSNALRRAFGKDACNRRYDADKSSHPEECRVARAEWIAARDAWRAVASKNNWKADKKLVGWVVEDSKPVQC